MIMISFKKIPKLVKMKDVVRYRECLLSGGKIEFSKLLLLASKDVEKLEKKNMRKKMSSKIKLENEYVLREKCERKLPAHLSSEFVYAYKGPNEFVSKEKKKASKEEFQKNKESSTPLTLVRKFEEP